VIATENDFACADLGCRLGGAGYLMSTTCSAFSATRARPIGGGSNEIQRNIIAQLMGL
jgi:alkylation response protein AidB-like acyl-CoA dehydrogenase